MTPFPAKGASGGSSGDQHRAAPSWGGPLTDADYAALLETWITREIADAAMLRRVDTHQGREVVGQKGHRDCAGILIPYYWPGDPVPFNYRLRRDHPDHTCDKDGKPKQERKYLGPPKGANRLYIPPGVTPEQLNDVSIPIVIVEGEKKALALWRLAWHGTDRPRFIPIAIAGVWSWRGTIGKANGPNGERVDVKGPVPDLNRIPWNGRKVFIVFDANIHTNESVKWARKGIARELATRHAAVDFVALPADCGVNGVDDLLAKWGPERVLELFANAVPAARLQVNQTTRYQTRSDGLFRIAHKGDQLQETQLTNFQATITTNITLDDGLETRREFEIEAALMSRTFHLTIPATRFAAMDWPIEQMGSGAITFPNQKEYARTAIQSCSQTAEERRIYTHTGWREINGVWVYLHADGAMGAAGAVEGVAVRLPGALSRFALRSPVDAAILARAVRASLLLVQLAPAPIGFPMLAATCRSVFDDPDFALHVTGETGVFKSELAALYQQHFGAGMDRQHLPGAWSSTANSLEALAFHAKNTLLTIDDFAPQGSIHDVARHHAAADRLFRAAGNLAGRARLDANANLREPKPPRGLILSTGEEIPRGHSIRARLLILDLAKGTIKPAQLSECQRDAQAGLYVVAMSGFLRWMAGRYAEARTAFVARAAELRLNAQSSMAHSRTPGIIADLQAAFEFYVCFAAECGAIDGAEEARLKSRCWEALRVAAAAQAKHHAATEPTAMYLASVRAALVSGRAHLESRTGDEPDWSPRSCGWRPDGSGRSLPQGDCIGWVDGDEIYLEPTATFRVVQVAGRDAGEALNVTQQTMNKRLNDKGLLASVDDSRETLTVRKTVGGSSRPVLHFRRGTLLPDEVDDDVTGPPEVG